MKTLNTTFVQTLKVSFLLIILFIGSNTYAQNKNKDNALLWKIEGNGLQKPSYLFGTVHMICEDKFSMPAKVKNAIDQTEQSYLEINLAAPDVAAQSQKYMKSTQPLSAQISAADYKIVDSVVNKKLKVGLKQLENIKPMLIVASIFQASFTCKVMSFESEIIKQTKAANKSIEGLSTIEEQYSFLDKIFDPKDMASYLKMNNDAEMNKIFKTIYEAYVVEDVNTIDQLMLEFSTTNPEGYRQLLPVRNHLWADRMPAIMKNKSTFFGIGCGHLLGKEGVISLLRSKGYKVTPVH
ncbi:TraB/GumN family protein [Pedobacter sp. Hv1]|uniref:TraB/GumN family protein n=1 Tax=Pedobacter sp. Hv1 TaxID=1740090 RepID=UPI0006D8CB26|nr:TraB/GumN family protein [Pedobacter sp. Hv1]KQC01840.1 polysaccharide biosynthesis protein GumN [Pedobacter sp. Hv1]